MSYRMSIGEFGADNPNGFISSLQVVREESRFRQRRWVIFELPGFATAASGTPQDSLDALRKASVTSYYKGKDALWVKVVSNGEGARTSGPGAGGTSVQVSR